MSDEGTITKADAIRILSDGLALAYHEARHVRILTKAGHLPLDPWAALIDLPREPDAAWKALLHLRKEAATRNGARGAAAVFEAALERTAPDLVTLFSNPNWQHTEALGGAAWRRVTACVLTLRDIIDSGNPAAFGPACAGVVYARHNTGRLRDKIIALDRAVGFATDPLWRSLVVDS